MKKALYILLAAFLIFMQGASWADEKGAGDVGKKGEMEELKSRVDALEEMMKNGVVTDELGHKLHPIHSLYGLKISGGLTMSAQGAAHMKGASHRGAFALSGDLALESPVGKDGRAVVVLDIQQGAGLQVTPNLFFTGPNGNPTGPNADVESFNNDGVHLTQLYYEHKILDDLVISMGQLDITGYFDANNFANNERMQFLANVFVNNPAIEFGGSVNFYGPGVRLTYSPAGNIDLTAGGFEGNGDYNDTFDNPFVMAEADLKAGISGKEGNYR
ncbi:MAG: carbohydrate porin, partial [Deltaproteobacteria bacterium]|nr:carbohydrate porin [Deltaproteobacteria bacterium]